MSLKVDKVNMPLSTHLKRHADGELRLRVQCLTRVDGFRFVEQGAVRITGVKQNGIELGHARYGWFPWPTLDVGGELLITLHNDGEARIVTGILKLTEVG
jgi:hypothetical protein